MMRCRLSGRGDVVECESRGVLLIASSSLHNTHCRASKYSLATRRTANNRPGAPPLDFARPHRETLHRRFAPHDPRPPAADDTRPMRLKHIEVVNAVMLTGTVSAAARLLHVTQPAVTQVLQHAEVQLGYALFTRQ